MEEGRYIGLNDGIYEGNVLIIFFTNAPKKDLKELEEKSCEVYKKGRGEKDVPIWSKVLNKKGYFLKYINSYKHTGFMKDAEKWQKEYYPDIEIYTIDNNK